MTDTDFAHDADLTHLWAERYRIPVITSAWPAWHYAVALTVPEPGVEQSRFALPRLVWPTEAEAVLIGSFIDFHRSLKSSHDQRRALERPLDIVAAGIIPVILAKAEDGWLYRRTGWNQIWVPIATSPTPAGLVQNLDRAAPGGPQWDAWKAAHPDIFATIGVTA